METKQLLLSIQDRGLKDFACIAYVLGGRIQEVRHLKPKDIKIIKGLRSRNKIIEVK